MSVGPTIQVTKVEPFTCWMQTRFPFRYGIASMTYLPHLFLRTTIEVNGQTVRGISSEGLPPKWFTKDPETTFEQDLPEMVRVIQQAAEFAKELGPCESVFRCWKKLHHKQASWAEEEQIPPLLANLGVSLLERSVIDGFCRAIKMPFGHALRENRFGMELGEIHPALDGEPSPANFLLATPLASIATRHTVGLADPLKPGDISDEDRAADTLPQALCDCIDSYDLRFFKIKLLGDLEKDGARLIELADLLEKNAPGYRYTLDGNEQFKDISTFQEHWNAHRAEPALASILSRKHLLFVEQPLHRDAALSPEVGEAFAEWEDAPPVIIDESDSELTSLPSALEIGYSGTSHKNCKGVFKGIANACLLAHLRAARHSEKEYILSGEDLANVGPVALLQDLAVMASLGISDVERNGHHYFSGLSAFPEEIQRAMTSRELHSDLYGQHTADGFAAVKISNGNLSIASVVDAPFGTRLDPNDDELMSLLGEPGWPNAIC